MSQTERERISSPLITRNSIAYKKGVNKALGLKNKLWVPAPQTVVFNLCVSKA